MPEQSQNGITIKQMAIVVGLMTGLSQLSGLFLDNFTREEVSQISGDVEAMATLRASVNNLITRVDVNTNTVRRLTDVSNDLSNQVNVLSTRQDLRLENVENRVENHQSSRELHANNTDRALENAETNVTQNNSLNQLEFRVRDLERKIQEGN